MGVGDSGKAAESCGMCGIRRRTMTSDLGVMDEDPSRLL